MPHRGWIRATPVACCVAFLFASCAPGSGDGRDAATPRRSEASHLPQGAAEGNPGADAGALPYILEASFSDRDRGWLALEDGTLLQTSDGGRRWQAITRFDGPAGVDFVSGESGSARRARQLLRTTDGGATWEIVVADLADAGVDASGPMEFVDGRHGYIATDERVYRTDDSGRTWKPVSPHPCAQEDVVRHAVSFVDPETGWLLCGFDEGSGFMSKRLYRSVDGGRKWTLVAEALVGDPPWEGQEAPGGLPIGDYVSSLFFFDERFGWYGTTRYGSLWRTDDGGRSWEEVRLPPLEAAFRAILDVDFVSPDEGYIVVLEPGRTRLLATEDGGETWEERSPPRRP